MSLTKYGDKVIGFESLVGKCSSGECYRRDGWKMVGETVGYTCKRVAGKGTHSSNREKSVNRRTLKLLPDSFARLNKIEGEKS